MLMMLQVHDRGRCRAGLQRVQGLGFQSDPKTSIVLIAQVPKQQQQHQLTDQPDGQNLKP